jgi:hypothetical protein
MRLGWGAWVLFLLVCVTAPAQAAPPDQAIIPIERYTTDKARSLATTHERHLRQIYDVIHRCHEWMEIQRLSFVAPRGTRDDARYLNVWVWIDQKITPAFAAAPAPLRASAMFQHYGIDLLRHLASHPPLAQDPALTGFAVVLTWMKPNFEPRPGVPGVSETLAVFVDKTTLQRFLARQALPAEFIQQAMINGFDGQAELAQLAGEVRNDFARNYRGEETGSRTPQC